MDNSRRSFIKKTVGNGVFDHRPKAKKNKDWRRMYDEMGKDFDVVVVATADHTHNIKFTNLTDDETICTV